MSKLHSLWIALIIVAFVAMPAVAQIELDSGGQVGIGTDPSARNTLSVECTKCGVYATGLEVQGIGGSGIYRQYGIRAHAEGGMFENRGIKGSASGSDSYGGYFTGGLHVSGGIDQNSDERMKTNIRGLNGTDMITRLSTIRPVQYEYRGEQELRQQGIPADHAEKGQFLGVLAQEVEEVFPELVSEVGHIMDEDLEQGSRGGEPDVTTTKAVNYQGLIVALLAAMQEQQAQIEELQQVIEQGR